MQGRNICIYPKNCAAKQGNVLKTVYEEIRVLRNSVRLYICLETGVIDSILAWKRGYLATVN